MFCMACKKKARQGGGISPKLKDDKSTKSKMRQGGGISPKLKKGGKGKK